MSEQIPKSPGRNTFVDFRYNGVQGWLRLLVFILLVMRPLLSLSQIVTLLEFYKESGARADLAVLINLEVAILAFLAAFSIYVGIRLVRISQGAVQTAKRYFVAEFVASFLLALADFQIASAFGQQEVSQIFLSILKAGIAAGFWLLYLNQSKRVRATYRS